MKLVCATDSTDQQNGSLQETNKLSQGSGIEEPPVILLGGASGCGKTTIANLLVEELGLSHHLSTGFIRASITHLLPEPDAELLKKHTYDAYQALTVENTNGRSPLMEGAIRQSLLLKPAIESCIKRAKREGIGMMLEGSHFIPGVLEPATLGASILCILDVPDREELKHRALSPNHTNRKLSDEQLSRLVQLQEGILKLARTHQQPVIINNDLTAAVDQIKALLNKTA